MGILGDLNIFKFSSKNMGLERWRKSNPPGVLNVRENGLGIWEKLGFFLVYNLIRKLGRERRLGS